MSPGLLLVGILAGSPSVGDLWPCVKGVGLEYALTRDGRRLGTTVADVALGPRPGGLCALERTTRAKGRPARTETLMVERLKDRLLWAGEAGQLTAFRPPLVKGPLRVGTKWSFAGVRYRITAVDAVVESPAGRFTGGVRVEGRSLEAGAHHEVTVYVPGVGPVLRETNGLRWVPIRRLRAGPRKREAPSKSGG